MVSEGCDDKVRSGGCGLASIYVDGEQKAPQKRGHNFVVISALTGKENCTVQVLDDTSCGVYPVDTSFLNKFCQAC